LKNTRGEKLLINIMLKAKLIKRGIPELSPIVTGNGLSSWDAHCSTSKPSSESAQTLHPCFSRRKLKNNEDSHQQ
jgi:hypothetical protein